VLGLVAAVLLGAFVLAERRAAEPVVPLRLFRSRVFNVANGLGLVIGVVLFGAIIYIPAFFQMAQGASATEAGLGMLPMMAGVLAAAVWSGQRISATGTYRRFPIAGMALGAPGLALLSRLEADTPYPLASSFLLVLGVGTGLSMQVLVLAVQNAACGCRLFGSRHATCAYSWISPPSRSRRTTLPAGRTAADSPGPSGGTCPKARCGRCTLS
jgi:hypothetical protein